MQKRSIPLSLTCAAILALSALHPMQAAAETAQTVTEGAAQDTTAQEAVENESALDADAIPTDAAGNIISQETAIAIDNADLGADQLAEDQLQEDLAQSVAEAASETLPEVTDETDPAMDKSSIGAAFDDAYSFVKEETKVYLLTQAAVKQEPSEDAEEIGYLEKYDEVLLTGTNDYQYWEIEYNGEVAYLDRDAVTRDHADIEKLMDEESRRAQTEADSKVEQEEKLAEETVEAKIEWETALAESRRAELASQTRNPNWNGAVLSRHKGSVYGPTGKETYYNLNMSGCIRNMNRRGYYGEVWVRNDGCKMFGDYIMCAANLGLHPYGSLVECSLGTCIVVDTGGFASHNENQLDIAVTW